MDPKNRFHTPATYALERLDYAAAMVVLSAVVLFHASEVNWIAFAVAFAWIDLVGYIPGAVAYRRAVRSNRRMPGIYVPMYNFTHSFVTNGIVVLGWGLASGLDWAMLAGPIHLCGDRGIFGNIYKPLGLSYEPEEDPLFAKFASEFEAYDPPRVSRP